MQKRITYTLTLLLFFIGIGIAHASSYSNNNFNLTQTRTPATFTAATGDSSNVWIQNLFSAIGGESYIPSMNYAVTAIAQSTPNKWSSTGALAYPMGVIYYVSGVTEEDYEYQVGLAYNWSGGSGFTLQADVFGPSSSYPLSTTTAKFTGASVYPQDTVDLSMGFQNGYVVMTGTDVDTGATASLSYPAEGAGYFVSPGYAPIYNPDNSSTDWLYYDNASTSADGYYTGVGVIQETVNSWLNEGIYMENLTMQPTTFTDIGPVIPSYIDIWSTQDAFAGINGGEYNGSYYWYVFEPGYPLTSTLYHVPLDYLVGMGPYITYSDTQTIFGSDQFYVEAPAATNTVISQGGSTKLTVGKMNNGYAPYTYKWVVWSPDTGEFSPSSYKPISGATSNTYTFSTNSITVPGNYTFWAEVGDSPYTPSTGATGQLGAIVYSDPITITVKGALDVPTPQAFLSESNSTSYEQSITPAFDIDQGANAKISEEATGGSESYKYEWYEKSPGQSSFVLISGSNENNGGYINFSPTSADILGTYSFKVNVNDTSSKTSITSNTLNITLLQQLTTLTPTAALFTANSTKTNNLSITSLNRGKAATITSTVSGGLNSSYGYQWLEKAKGEENYTKIPFSGNYPTYLFDTKAAGNASNNSTDLKAGVYSFELQATDAAGGESISKPLNITVNSALSVGSPIAAELTIPEGDSKDKISVGNITNGTAPYTYAWFEKVPGNDSFYGIPGANQSTYEFPAAVTPGVYGIGVFVNDSRGQNATSTYINITVTPTYSRQELAALTENVPNLSYNVTAVAQSGTDRSGPSYLVNGVTNYGWWYQVGLEWNFSGEEGFKMGYNVFQGNGTLVQSEQGADNYADFSGPVNVGDTVELNLSFINVAGTYAYVEMSAHDWNTGANASYTYTADGAKYFVGNSANVTDLNGFFTGVMAEQYFSNTSTSPPLLRPVTFINRNPAGVSSEWLSVGTPFSGNDKFTVNQTLVYFQNNPAQKQSFTNSKLGALITANANETTFGGGSPLISVSQFSASNSVIAADGSTTITAEVRNGSAPYSYSWFEVPPTAKLGLKSGTAYPIEDDSNTLVCNEASCSLSSFGPGVYVFYAVINDAVGSTIQNSQIVYTSNVNITVVPTLVVTALPCQQLPQLAGLNSQIRSEICSIV